MSPRSAGLYVRISSDPSGERLGVTRQRSECEAKAAALGWQVVRLYEDNDVSASSTKPRPSYRRMLADLEAGVIDGVVVWDLDRLTRRPLEIEEFIDLADRKGVALASVGGDVDLATDNGRLFARIKGAVARAEIERKSARQRSANLQRAAAGKPPSGRRAFGYAAGGQEVVPAEATQIVTAATSLLAGDSLHGIVRCWNSKGVPTTAGGSWHPTELRRLLSNPRYAGIRTHLGDVVGPGDWPAILDQGTHAAVVAVLRSPERHRAGPPRRYLLSGIARCGVCEARVFGVTEAMHKGALYRCETRKHVSRKADPVDDLVTEAVIARLSRPDAVALFARPTNREAPEALRAEEGRLRERLQDVAEAFAAGDIDRAQMVAATATLRGRIDQVSEQLATCVREPVLTELLTASDVRTVWNDLPLERQREVVKALLHVHLDLSGQGARTFNPETVRLVWRTDEGSPR